jgi:nucleotide-binding universal stress UspA family protein
MSSTLTTRILVPIDSSPNAKRALEVGVELALNFRAELLILNAVRIDKYGYHHSRHTESEAQQLVDQAVFSARDKGVAVKGLVRRAEVSVVKAIIDCAAEQKIDLIVIGTRGQGGFEKLLLGSVSSGTLAHSTCNILVVR